MTRKSERVKMDIKYQCSFCEDHLDSQEELERHEIQVHGEALDEFLPRPRPKEQLALMRLLEGPRKKLNHSRRPQISRILTLCRLLEDSLRTLSKNEHLSRPCITNMPQHLNSKIWMSFAKKILQKPIWIGIFAPFLTPSPLALRSFCQ